MSKRTFWMVVLWVLITVTFPVWFPVFLARVAWTIAEACFELFSEAVQ